MVFRFSLSWIFQYVWETFFNLWCSHSWLIIESVLRYSWISPPLKIPDRNFCFPQDRRGDWEKTMICSIKVQWENMKMTWNSSLFPFGMIVVFLNVMVLQFWKYLSNSVVLSLLLLLCNHGNCTLKLHQKILLATLMKAGFL